MSPLCTKPCFFTCYFFSWFFLFSEKYPWFENDVCIFRNPIIHSNVTQYYSHWMLITLVMIINGRNRAIHAKLILNIVCFFSKQWRNRVISEEKKTLVIVSPMFECCFKYDFPLYGCIAFFLIYIRYLNMLSNYKLQGSVSEMSDNCLILSDNCLTPYTFLYKFCIDISLTLTRSKICLHYIDLYKDIDKFIFNQSRIFMSQGLIYRNMRYAHNSAGVPSGPCIRYI